MATAAPELVEAAVGETVGVEDSDPEAEELAEELAATTFAHRAAAAGRTSERKKGLV